MARYKYPSDFYADDKDISDLLELNGFNAKKLVQLGLEHSIVLSPELGESTLVDYLALFPCSWPELQNLLRTIETPDKQEKTTTCRYETSATVEEIEKAIDDVRDIRSTIDDEAYSRKRTEKGIFIRIFFSEMEPKSTRTIQRTHEEIEILIASSENGYEVRYPDVPRAEAIVVKIFDLIPVPEGQEKAGRTKIELAGVVAPDKRTAFFVNLIDGLAGFRRRDVIDLKVNRIFSNGSTQSSSKDVEREAEEQAKQAVKRMGLSGESLLTSPEFIRLAEDGFAIYRIIWESMEESVSGRIFELEALFRNPEAGTRFCYSIRGIRERDQARDRYVLRKHIPLNDKNHIHKLVENAAYAALETLRTSINELEEETPV